MADPFNFEALRKQTPSYLGLGSLKEALPKDHELSREHAEPVAAAMADVSMEDQVVSDDEEEPDVQGQPMEIEPASSRAAETTDFASEKSVNAAENASVPSDEAQSSSALAPAAPAPAPVHKVLSPTQFGAHWALDSAGPGHGYDYEVRMPIPAPWHENLPYILSTYLQLLFNVGVGIIGVWLVLVAKRDVSAIIRERSDEIAIKASWCHQQYILNQCTPDLVVPYLYEKCRELERCMDRDPSDLRWLSVHASLLSEVLNALIEPLTMRTMVSLGLLAFSIGLAVFMINYLFGFLRARTYFPEKRDSSSVGSSSSNGGRQKQLQVSAKPRHPHTQQELGHNYD